jgi:hypothetical protein
MATLALFQIPRTKISRMTKISGSRFLTGNLDEIFVILEILVGYAL